MDRQILHNLSYCKREIQQFSYNLFKSINFALKSVVSYSNETLLSSPRVFVNNKTYFYSYYINVI